MNDTSSVRQTVSAAIAALDGWTASRWGPELFGRDTAHMMHHAFVVSMPETELTTSQRQKVAEGLVVTTTLEVQWAHNLRGDGQLADYDAALDAEQDVVGAVRGIATLHVLFQRATRRVVAEGWVLGTVRFQAVHLYRLTD